MFRREIVEGIADHLAMIAVGIAQFHHSPPGIALMMFAVFLLALQESAVGDHAAILVPLPGLVLKVPRSFFSGHVNLPPVVNHPAPEVYGGP